MSSLISLSVQDQDPDPSSCPLPSVLSPSLRLIRDATESVVQGQPWPLLHFRSVQVMPQSTPYGRRPLLPLCNKKD
uniref:Uncharacterized protein n=1 Tax=Cannabis sativa TaxID=3483 RepID=A0A803QZ32_CANSA